jgi:hypothetical protein
VASAIPLKVSLKTRTLFSGNFVLLAESVEPNSMLRSLRNARLVDFVGGALLSLLLGGCATWHVPITHQDWKLPAQNSGSDSVTFEIAFVRWPSGLSEEAGTTEGTPGDLWRALDEQFLPPELRQNFAANGMRAGIISDPLPNSIRAALEATSDPLSVITDQNASPGTEVLARRERRQCPSESRQEIEVLPMREGKRIVLANESGRVRAEEFEQPRGFIRFTTHAMGDGRVRAELVPIIDFGKPKQRIIGGQGAYRYDTRRDERVYDKLEFSTALFPGRTLVLTSSTDKKGLGAVLFADRFEGSPDQLLLLIRIAETQRDELFSPRTQQESLVTPLE